MARQLEVELDAGRSVALRVIGSNRVALATRRRHAVQRPCDRLEQRRFSGTVRTDDARDPRIEVDAGVHVLPEVAELKSIEAHQVSISAAGATWTTVASSMYRTALS